MELSYEFVPGGKRLHCFNLTAIDDEYVESTEYHKVWLQTMNQLDKIDMNVAIITITDNDGECGNLYTETTLSNHFTLTLLYS